MVTVNDSVDSWLSKHSRPMTHVIHFTQRDHILYVINLHRPPIVYILRERRPSKSPLNLDACRWEGV